MHQNNFIQALHLLSKSQQKRFVAFLESPYFNKQVVLVKITKKLLNIAPTEKKALERNHLWARLFPGETYQLKQLRYLLSDLMQLLRQFLQVEIQQSDYEKQFWVAKSARKLDANKWYLKEWERASTKLEMLPHRNAQFFLSDYHHQLEAQDYLSRQSRSGYTLLEKAQGSLFHFFAAEQLKLACLFTPDSDEPLNIHFLPTLLDAIEKKPGDFPVVVQLYYHAYIMLHGSDSGAHFQRLSQVLQEHYHLFPNTELEDLYLMAINYCIRQLNQGDQTYIQRAFDLYEQGIENGALLAQGYLSVFNYKNVIRLGLALRQTDWVEAFMERYKLMLPPEDRENTYKYNLAFYYYNKPDYDRAMELLRDVRLKDVFNNMDARRMLTRIYFEKEEWVALDSWLESFKAYVLRQKGIGYHRTAYRNFIRTVRQLMNADTSAKRTKTHRRIMAYERIVDREWLAKLAFEEE